MLAVLFLPAALDPSPPSDGGRDHPSITTYVPISVAYDIIERRTLPWVHLRVGGRGFSPPSWRPGFLRDGSIRPLLWAVIYLSGRYAHTWTARF
jgi:hypothetical protein